MGANRAGRANTRENTRGRPWAGGVAAGSLAVAAVVLLVAQAAMAGVAPNLTLTAPYKTAKVKLTNPRPLSGCGTGVTVNPATFSRTTGFGGFSDNATSKWCTSSTNNSATVEGSIAVTLPVHVKTTTTHTITVIWVTTATGSTNLTAGTCTGNASTHYSGCTRSVKAYVYGSAFLLDKVTHKKTKPSVNWPGNFTYLSSYTSCVYTSCSTSGSGGGSSSLHTGASFWYWQWNATPMNASHNYSLSMVVFGGAEVTLEVSGATLSGASGNAQLNSATLGNNEELYSVTVS